MRRIVFALLLLIPSASFAASGLTTSYSVTTTSTQVLAANPGRVYMLVSNQGPNIVYCGSGTGNAATTGMNPIPVGGNWELGSKEYVPQGDVACITASSTSTVAATDR